ncbi:hypothetical protein KP79_PYT05617 [Mizuhopecten yessoensis]|uniref:Uncharacterized protein n=3 Tax=Mizuhopecten yessoensis TaxID=6573 RepID=A0A210QSV2_MIZYE|nr:hypothetical protein KP79_PYT05617 [Mizuhopecten yessoensis]
MGVHVCRHADVQLRLAEVWGLDTCNIVIFKVILGKCKVLSTQGNTSENVEPTPNFDCHISKTKPSLSDSVSIQAARSQIYLYEYNEDCETVERPRHCIPHAIVSYNRKSSRTVDTKAKGYTSEKSSGYSRTVNRSADNSRSSRPTARQLLQSDVHVSPAAATLARQPSWPARIVTEGEGQSVQTSPRIPVRSFSSDTTLPTTYRIGQDQQMHPSPGLETVDVYQTRKDPRVRRNSAQELEELSAQDVDLRPNRGASQDFDGRIMQVADYNHGHFVTGASQSNLVTDSSLAWFDNTSGSDVSFSSQDVDYRKMYRSQAEQVSSAGGEANYETYSTVGRRLSQGSGCVLSDPRLNRTQGRSISSESQLSEDGQTGGDNSNSDASSNRKKKVKTQISLAAYKARKKQIEESKTSEFSPSENSPVPNINMDVDNLKNILQTMNPNRDNPAASTTVGSVSAVEASEILEKFDRIPDVKTHLANFDVSNLKMILETAKTPTETPTSPGFPSQDTPSKSEKSSVKNGLESNSIESNSTHDESQNTESKQTIPEQSEQIVFSSSLRNKTEDEIIFFPNVKSKDLKPITRDQSPSSVVMLTEQKTATVKGDTARAGGESVTEDSFFSRVKSEGEFSTDRSKIPGLSASPSEESENMDADLVKQHVSSESVSDSKSDNSAVLSETTLPPIITGESTPFKHKRPHFLGDGIDNKISPISHGEHDDSDLGNISCEGSLASHHTSLDNTLNSSPIKSFSEFHHLTPKQLKAFIESQTQLMKHYKDPRDFKTAADRESPEEKKKLYRPTSGTASSPLTISSESSSQKTLETADSQKSYMADVSSQESSSMLMSKPKAKPKVKANKDMMGYKRRRRRKKKKKTDNTDDVDTESISLTSTTSSDYLWMDDNFDRLSDRSRVTPTPSECAETRQCRSDNTLTLSDYQLSHWTQAAIRPDFQPRVVLTDVRKRTCSISTGSEISWKISSTNSTIELEQETEPASGKDLQLDTDDMYTRHTEERVKQWIQVARKKIKLTLKPVKKEEEKKTEEAKEAVSVIPVFVGSGQTQMPSSPVKQDLLSENRHMSEDKSSYQDPDLKSDYPSNTDAAVAVPELAQRSEYLQRDPTSSSHYMETPDSYTTPPSTYNDAVTTFKPPVTTYNPTVTTYTHSVTTYNPQVTTFTPSVTTYNPPVTTYNPQVTTYNPPVTTYTPPATVAYNPSLTTHNPPATTYNPQATTYNPPLTTYNPSVSTYTPPVTSYNPSATTYNPAVSTYISSAPAYPPHTAAASVPNTVFAQPMLPAASSYPPHTMDTATVQASSYPPQGSTQMMPPSRPPLDTGQDPLASPLQPPPGARVQMPPGPPRPQPPLQPPQAPVGMSRPPHRPSSFDPRLQNAPAILPRVIDEQVPRHQAQMTISEAGRPPNPNYLAAAAAGPPHHLQLSQHAPLQRPPGMRPQMVSKAPPVLHGSDMMGGMSSGEQLPYPPNTPTNIGPGPAGNPGLHPPHQPQFFSSSHQHPPPQMHQHPQMSSAMPHLPPSGTSILGQRPGQTRPNMAIPPPRTQVPGVSAAMATRPPHPGGQLRPPGVMRGPGVPQQIVHQPIRGPGPPPQGINQPQSLGQQGPRQQVHMGNGPPLNRPLHHVRPPVHQMGGHPPQTSPSANVPLGGMQPRPPNQIPTLVRMQHQQQGGQYQVSGFPPPPQNSSGMFRSGAFAPQGGPPGNLQGAPPGMPQHPQQHYPNTAPPFQQPRMQHNFPPGYNRAPPLNPMAAPLVATTTTKRSSDVMDWFTDKLAPKKSSSDTGDHGNKTGSANSLFDIAFSGTKPNTRPDHFLGISSQHMCAGTPTTQGPEGTEKQEGTDRHKGKERQEENDRHKGMVRQEGQNRHEGLEKQEGKNVLEGMERHTEQNRQGMKRQEGIDKHERMERQEGKNRHERMEKHSVKDKHEGTDRQEGIGIQEGKEKHEAMEIQEEVDMEIETSSDDSQDVIIVLGEEETMANKQKDFYDADAVRTDILKRNVENYDSSNETILLDEKTDEKNTCDMVRDIKCDFSTSESSVDSSGNGRIKDRNGNLEEYKQDSSDSVPVTMQKLKPVLDFLNRNVLTEMDINNLADPSRRSGIELPKPETATTSGKNIMQGIHQEQPKIIDSIQKSKVHAVDNQNVTTTASTKNNVEEGIGGLILHVSESTLKKIDNQTLQNLSSVKIHNKSETLPCTAPDGQKTESPVLQTKSVLKLGDQFVPSVLLRRGLLKGAEADKLKHPVISKKVVSKEDKLNEPTSPTYSVLRGASDTGKETNDCTEKSLKIKLTIGTPNSSSVPELGAAAAGAVTDMSLKVASEDIYVLDDLKKTLPSSTPNREKELSQQAATDKCDKEMNIEQNTSSSSDFDILDAILVKDLTESKKSGKNLVNITHSKKKSSASNDSKKTISGTKKVEDNYDKKHKTTCIYNAKTGAWTTKSSEENTSTESDIGDYSPSKEYWKTVQIYEDLETSFGTESEREHNARRDGSWLSRTRQYSLGDSKDNDSETSIFDPKIGAWVDRGSVSRKSEERAESKRNAVVYDFRRGAWTTGEEMSSYKSKNKESIDDNKRRSKSTDCEIEVIGGGMKEGKESEKMPIKQSEFDRTATSNRLNATKDGNIAGEGKTDQRQVLLGDKSKQQQSGTSDGTTNTIPSNSNIPCISDTTLEPKSSAGAKEVVIDTKASIPENREMLSPLKSTARDNVAQSKMDKKKTSSTSPPGKRQKTTKEIPFKTGTISDLFSDSAKTQKSIAYQLSRSMPGRGRSTSYSSSEESSRRSQDSWNYNNIYGRQSWKRYSRSPSYSPRSRPRRRYSRSRSSSSERRQRRRYSRSRSYSSESRSRKRYSRSRSYSSESRSRRRHSRSRSRSSSRSRKRYSRSPSYRSRSRSRRRYSRSPSSSVSRSRKRNSRSPSYSTISSASDRTAFSPRGSWRGHRRHSDAHRSVHNRRSRSRFSRSPSYSSISTVSDVRPSQYQSRRRSRSRYSRSPSCSTVSTSSCRSFSPRTKDKSSPWASSDSSRQPRYSKFTSSRFPLSQKPPDADKRSKINPAINNDRKTVHDNSQEVTNERKQSSPSFTDKNAKDVSSSKAGTSESSYSSSQNSHHKGGGSSPTSKKIDLDSGHRRLFRDKPPPDYSRSPFHHREAGRDRCRSPSPRQDRISKETTPLKQDPPNVPRISSPYSPSSPTKGCPGDLSPIFSRVENTAEKLSSRDSAYAKPSSALGRSPDRNVSNMASRLPHTDRPKQLSYHPLRDSGNSKEEVPIKFLFKDKITRKVSLSPERPSDRNPHSWQTLSGNTQRKERYSRSSSRDRARDFPVSSSISQAKRPRKEIAESFVADRRNVQTGRDLRAESSSSSKDSLLQRRSHNDDFRHVSARKTETTGDQRKFEQFDSFSLDYLAKAQEKLRRELSGLDGPGCSAESQDLDTGKHNENTRSKPSEEIRVISVERKKPLVSYDSQSRKEISDRGQNKDIDLTNTIERKELPLYRNSWRRVSDQDEHQIIRDVSDRTIDRRVVIKSQEDDCYSQHSSGRDRSDFHPKVDVHRKDDLYPRDNYHGRGDVYTGNTIYPKDGPYKNFPDWKNNPRTNHPYKRDSSVGNVADDWSQSLSIKGVQERLLGTKTGTPLKPGQKGQGENFNDLLMKEQMRHNIIKKKPLENVPQETALSKGERTVTASNQSECISMCSCSTTIPLSKNDLKEELIRVTRSMEKLWKEPLEQMESMADRLPKELEEFCIQSGLTQLELENSKVIPQARSAIIRQDVQQFEAEIKMRITQSNYFGVCSQRVPAELLTKQEENKFFSEEGMFLILCNPIPSKTYQKLSALKKKLDELQDKIDFETKNSMASVVRSLSTEKQLAREERKRQLFTFTGCLTKKRLNKMRVKERYFLRCYNYFRKEYGEAADEMFPYLKMCIDDSANHIAVMTKLRSEDKDEAAIVEEEKRKEREKIQRQRVLQGLMMDIRTVDSKLSDMYFSCDITEHFPASVKSVVQHVHQRVNSVAEFLSEELMSDEPNSGAVGRLRATHKFCLKAYEFVKKNLAEANNPGPFGKLSGQEMKNTEFNDVRKTNEMKTKSDEDERKPNVTDHVERKNDGSEMNYVDKMDSKLEDDGMISDYSAYGSDCHEGKSKGTDKETSTGTSCDAQKKIDYFDIYNSEEESDNELEKSDNLSRNNSVDSDLKSDNFDVESGKMAKESDELNDEVENIEEERERSYMKMDVESEKERICLERELNDMLGAFDTQQETSPIRKREIEVVANEQE